MTASILDAVLERIEKTCFSAPEFDVAPTPGTGYAHGHIQVLDLIWEFVYMRNWEQVCKDFGHEFIRIKARSLEIFARYPEIIMALISPVLNEFPLCEDPEVYLLRIPTVASRIQTEKEHVYFLTVCLGISDGEQVFMQLHLSNEIVGPYFLEALFHLKDEGLDLTSIVGFSNQLEEKLLPPPIPASLLED